MKIAIRSNEAYRNYAERFTDSVIQSAPYNYKVVEVGTIPEDCIYSDFDYIGGTYVFNQTKYDSRTKTDTQSLYEQRVVELIRQKYTLSQELAILRQQTTKPEEYQEYFEYCEYCKAQAKTQYNIQ